MGDAISLLTELSEEADFVEAPASLGSLGILGRVESRLESQTSVGR